MKTCASAIAICLCLLTTPARALVPPPQIANSGPKQVQADDISTRVGTIIAQQLRLYSPVVAPSSILKNLGADDLDMVEIGLQLEQEFNITIRDEDLAKLSTVGEAVELVEKSLAPP